ncbi:hypothetical protein OPIT5_25920 [Opitutaceae bacterium TAV5]|nr:hypothetical protein OPIT5_25920 [Opitutaceae bacterium TAV5]
MNYKTTPDSLFPREVSRLMAALAIFLTTCVFALAATAQTVIIEDTFSLSGTRIEGSRLGGTSPETQLGNATWVAATTLLNGVFTADGKITSYKNTAGTIYPTAMGIAVPSAYIGGVMTITADIITDTTGWISVGFWKTTPSGDTWAGSTDNVLSVFVKSNGDWNLIVNGEVSTIKGKINGYNASVSYNIGLSLDMDTQKVRVFLTNGTTDTTLKDWVDAGLSTADTASIGVTAFRIHTSAGVSDTDKYSIDNFKLTTSLAIVPEPGNVALLLALTAGLAVGLLAWRKSHLSR